MRWSSGGLRDNVGQTFLSASFEWQVCSQLMGHPYRFARAAGISSPSYLTRTRSVPLQAAYQIGPIATIGIGLVVREWFDACKGQWYAGDMADHSRSRRRADSARPVKRCNERDGRRSWPSQPCSRRVDNASRGTPGSAPYVTRQSDVEIPFSVRQGATPQTQPTAVRVFVSWDRGQNWHFYDERKPTDRRFRFRAKQDGEFWFATQTIDASGKPDSPEPRTPQLRVIIDTQRPQLLVQAQWMARAL